MFRPSDAGWHILNTSNNTQRDVTFGTAGDTPVPGDYDGDGRTDIAVLRPPTAAWYLIRSRDGAVVAWWGAPTDMPVPGDYEGDGKADPAVFRPSAGAWFILRSRDGAVATSWGGPSDFPLAADYDGDRRVDPTVFRPSYRNWYQILSGTATSRYITFGNAGDLPL